MRRRSGACLSLPGSRDTRGNRSPASSRRATQSAVFPILYEAREHEGTDVAW
jgi:hypothetical protein